MNFKSIYCCAAVLAKFSHQLRDLVSDWRHRYQGMSVMRTPVLVASIGVTAILLGLRHFGQMEVLELGAYDQMLRSRPPEKIDNRLLVVAVTEEDIQKLRQWPLSDAILAQALEKLERHQPTAIGLDIYRDMPVEPGNQQLASQLKKSDRVIAICRSSDAGHLGVAAPSAVPVNRVGFSDFPIDPDGAIRRALLFLSPGKGKCQTKSAFSIQLATRYLANLGIQSFAAPPSGYMALGKVPKKSENREKTAFAPANPRPLVVFPRLDPLAGSYQGIDAAGYQILLNYRSGQEVAPQVTLQDVLADRVPKESIRDRIVLIGVTAASIDDAFYTPFSSVIAEQAKMPGVVVHAQIISQILSAALDGRPLLWYWPNWLEALWIWAWGMAGGLIAWQLRHPLWLGLSGAGVLTALGSICYGTFVYAGWIPFIPAGLGAIATGGSVVVYAAYKMHQQQMEIAREAQEQQATIALLTTMLKNPLPSDSGTLPFSQAATIPIGESPTVPVSLPSENVAPSPVPLFPFVSACLGGRYQITKVLAQGGFGQTYLARDTQRPGHPICVVKHLMPARRDVKFLQVARRLFQTEAKILEVLGQHSQIPQLFAYLEEEEEFYLVEEYVEGVPLSDELPIDRRVSESLVVDLSIGILEILAFIHQHQVIHRDIKPSNIIRRKQDNKLVLIDFGAVKQIQPPIGPETESPTVAIGTRGYAPPEQLAGHPRPASDIYAVGMIAIQALTGIQPQHLTLHRDTGCPIWRPLAKVNDELAEILDRMVAYHFSDRYQSATAVLKDLYRLDRSLLNDALTERDLKEISTNQSNISNNHNHIATHQDPPSHSSAWWDATISVDINSNNHVERETSP